MRTTTAMIPLLVLALTTGCTQQKGGPMPTHYEDALSQLNGAAASKPGAKQPDAVSQALLPPLVVEMPRAEPKPTEARFDLAVNNAPASEVFMSIASGSPYSMIVHPSINEKISIKLNNATLFEALDTLRDMYGYEYKVTGNRIFIQPLTMQTRVFLVNYLNNMRKGKSELRVASSSPSDSPASTQAGATSAIGTQAPIVQALASAKVETTSDVNFWSDLTNAVRAIIGNGEGRNMIINAESGVVVVRAMPSELREVAEFLRTMQGVVSRQVLLEAKIIDVQLSDSFATGINWAAFHAGSNARFGGGIQQPATNLTTQGAMSTLTTLGPDGQPAVNSIFTATPGVPGSMVTGGGVPGTIIGLAFQTSNFAALLDFLQTQGELQVLSSPRIAAINNQKAVLKVGTDQFFVTNVTTNQTTTVGGFIQNSPTITTQPFFSGVALDITPQIDENNQIILHIHPSVSNVVNQNTSLNLGSAGIFTLPLAASTVSETDTVVRVANSNIVAIGGLMKQQDQRNRSGVPGLMDIPIIGTLFKNTSRSGLKSELVILIKPTVIESEESWKPSVQEAANRIRDWRHDEFGRYWKEEVVQQGKDSVGGQPNTGGAVNPAAGPATR
ncbi:MAG TPA: pilus (MSHA type) biogenesis protein MshL [Burkholderiales bacterium]|nr:pilus (MSHA type) biogenesis protein MshL [Burkholderiales bacterium]